MSCQGEGPVPKGPDRLPWKVDTLERLRAKGIWLVDASITALAAPGGKRRFPTSLEQWILRTSWERFVWPTVERDDPEHVWVIGKGVGRALEGHSAIRADRVISQPQSRDAQRYRQELDRMVGGIKEALGH